MTEASNEQFWSEAIVQERFPVPGSKGTNKQTRVRLAVEDALLWAIAGAKKATSSTLGRPQDTDKNNDLLDEPFGDLSRYFSADHFLSKRRGSAPPPLTQGWLDVSVCNLRGLENIGAVVIRIVPGVQADDGDVELDPLHVDRKQVHSEHPALIYTAGFDPNHEGEGFYGCNVPLPASNGHLVKCAGGFAPFLVTGKKGQPVEMVGTPSGLIIFAPGVDMGVRPDIFNLTNMARGDEALPELQKPSVISISSLTAEATERARAQLV